MDTIINQVIYTNETYLKQNDLIHFLKNDLIHFMKAADCEFSSEEDKYVVKYIENLIKRIESAKGD